MTAKIKAYTIAMTDPHDSSNDIEVYVTGEKIEIKAANGYLSQDAFLSIANKIKRMIDAE